MCEIAAIVSGIIAVLWALNITPLHEYSVVPNAPLYVAGLVALSFVAGVLGLILQRRERRNEPVTLLVVLLMEATSLTVAATTGGIHSPYVILWMLAGIFSALIGFKSLLPTLLLLAGFVSYSVGTNAISTDEWVITGITLLLPLIVSYLIWSRRLQGPEKGGSAVSVLAQELSQESNKSGIIINAIADGVIVVDGKGIIQLINPAAQNIVGWGKDDAVKLDYRSVLKITDNKDALVSEELDPVQRCIRTNEAIVTDKLGLRTIAGKKLLASILVSPLGEVGAGAIIVFRDITTQHAEEREQAEFISTASHEMRTPVAAIEGYLGLALNPQTAVIDDKARAYLGKAHESAQHLGRLFQDLLDISKLEDGRLKNDPSIIDVTARARAILADFNQAASEKGLNLVFKPDQPQTGGQPVSPIFYTSIDPDHFREIFSNLIENALKYTKEGSISVDVNGNEERVILSVQDTGIGIPAEDIPHLFQKFYRVDNSDTREIGGTGLGLYLSRRLAEAMGGQLNVDSEYGKGSTFTMELPRLSKDQVDTALQQANQAPQQPEVAKV